MPPTAGETTTSIVAEALADLLGQRPAQALGARRILEHEHLLQEDRRVQARGQDEMAFEQGARGAKFVKHVVLSSCGDALRDAS